MTCKKNGLQLHMTKPEKLLLFLLIFHCFHLFGIFFWYLKNKIRNLMEYNSLLLVPL